MTEVARRARIDIGSIAYAEDCAGWAEWQQAYRFGVLLILPPPAIAAEIDSLRRRYDPASAAISPPHISVSNPFTEKMTVELCDEICRALSFIRPFELWFEKPHASSDYAGVSYPIYPQASIDALKYAVHSVSAFSGSEHERQDIPAHMTIAEFISIEDSLLLCEKLEKTAAKTAFTCDCLTLVVPDQDFHFREAGYFLFGNDE